MTSPLEAATPDCVYLEILRGVAHHRIRPINSPVFLIGAAKDCDLILGDTAFPEIHSYLLLSGTSEQPEVVLHRVAGPPVSVLGQSAETTEIPDGAIIRTGGYLFQIHHRSRWVQIPASSQPHPSRPVEEQMGLPDLRIFRDSA